jgi:hypothetical protein
MVLTVVFCEVKVLFVAILFAANGHCHTPVSLLIIVIEGLPTTVIGLVLFTVMNISSLSDAIVFILAYVVSVLSLLEGGLEVFTPHSWRQPDAIKHQGNYR